MGRITKGYITVKLLILVASTVLSILALLATNDIDVATHRDFISSFITAFSILAGALLAVFGLVLTPFRNANWKRLENNREFIQRDVILFQGLFILYLIALLLILGSLLLSGSYPKITHVMQDAYILVGTFTLTYSLYLPFKISSVIMRDIDSTIQEGKS